MQLSLSWWDKNTDISTFKQWVKGVNVPSRRKIREYLNNKYTTVLDVGSGLCEDYYGFLALGGKIHYEAVDFTNQFVEADKKVGIKIRHESCEKMSYPDKDFDAVYCRHLLEHLSYYEKTLEEMMRIARHEVIVTFFFPPTDKPDEILLNNTLNHNTYNKQGIEDCVWKNKRVYDVKWEKFSNDESILYIYLHD